MSTVVKIALGIVLGFVLLIGGCVALLAVGTSLPPTPGSEEEDSALEDGGSEKKGSTAAKTKTRRFSGTGSKNVGTVRVPSRAVLEWEHDSATPGGGIFIVNDEEFGLTVNSQGSSGDSAVKPGTYKNIDVTADGSWKMTIKPR